MDAELDAASRHGRDDRGAGDAVGGVEGGFARRHREVQVEVVIGAEEVEHRGRRVRRRRPHQRRREQTGEKRGGRNIAIVALVAHVQRLGDQRPVPAGAVLRLEQHQRPFGVDPRRKRLDERRFLTRFIEIRASLV